MEFILESILCKNALLLFSQIYFHIFNSQAILPLGFSSGTLIPDFTEKMLGFTGLPDSQPPLQCCVFSGGMTR